LLTTSTEIIGQLLCGTHSTFISPATHRCTSAFSGTSTVTDGPPTKVPNGPVGVVTPRNSAAVEAK
jgi:hypothetical protein